MDSLFDDRSSAASAHYQVMPPLSDDDFALLKADIADRGVLIPVEYDEAGNVLDGHHRVKACAELGITEWPRFVRKGLSEDEKRLHARQLNLARRHLNQLQKRELIAEQLKDTPEMSNRQIAAGLGVNDKTVGAVRDVMEESAEIPHLSVRVDPRTGNLSQPARKPIRTAFIDPSPVNRQATRAEEFKEFGNEAAKLVRGTFGTGENEWYTPSDWLDRARTVLGRIDLDPASSPLAQRTVKAKQFYTVDDDGLSKPWHGRVWMNPPYAQPAIGDFSEKLAAEVEAGNVKAAIALTHNYTDTKWFHRLAGCASAICFPEGRIRFVAPDGTLASPTQGQAFFYFGKEFDLFRATFGDVGAVLSVLR